MMKYKYSQSIFWLFLFAIAVCAYMLISVQDITRASFIKNEGIVIDASECEDIEPIGIPIINMQDDRWGMKIMCDDLKIRICEYGSQLCATASIFRKYGISWTPNELYDEFDSNGLYSHDGSSQFCDVRYEFMTNMYKLTYESPTLNTETLFNSETVISLLKSGTPVLVRTSHPNVGRYWVAIVGVQEGEFVIMDPLEDELSVLSTYYNKVYQLYYFS